MALVFPVYDDQLWQQPQEGQVPATLKQYTRDVFNSIAPVLFENTNIGLNSGSQIAIAAANAGLPMLITYGFKANAVSASHILIVNFDNGFPVAGFEVNIETVDGGGGGVNQITKQFIVQDQTVTVLRFFNQGPVRVEGWVRGTRVARIPDILPSGGGGGGNVTIDDIAQLAAEKIGWGIVELINQSIAENDALNTPQFPALGKNVQRSVGKTPPFPV